MIELDNVFLLLRCASVVYIVRFIDRRCGSIFTDNKVFRKLPLDRAGVWGYILLLVSFAVAAPSLMGDSQEDGSPGNESPGAILHMFNPSMWPKLPSFGWSSSSNSPTISLDTSELAEYYGYKGEKHWVTTEDGYILGVHRIYNESCGGPSRPVVIIHHAFVLNSREFLTLGPGRALGYVLADAGFDVWLCNARGNTYSRNHTTLSPDQKEFWDFSFTEHGKYDLPAVIDYARNITGRSKVHYIGHSIGTISFLVMGTKRPEYLPKINSYTALAPILTTANARSTILRNVMRGYKIITRGHEKLGTQEFLPHFRWFTSAGSTICQNGWITQRICTAFLFSLAGNNPQFDNTILPEMLAHSPSGSSIKCLRHFGQNYYNGFREYDYGAEENLVRYNSTEPPLFDYSIVDVPSQLFYGLNDLMAEYTDSIEICKNLPNVFRCEAVEDPNFMHIDFIWASNAPALVYTKIIEGLKRHNDEDVTNFIRND